MRKGTSFAFLICKGIYMSLGFRFLSKGLSLLMLAMIVGCSGSLDTKSLSSDGGLGGTDPDPEPQNQSCQVGSVTLQHGEARHFYTTTSVACGQTCQSQLRTCTNGDVSGSNSFSNANCTAATCPTNNPCTLDGVTVAHGQPHEFFNSGSVACGQTCQKISRTCNNGDFSGDNSYNRSTCTVAACMSPCTLDGVTVAHGQPRTFFRTSSVACGQTCQGQSRTCQNGAFSGDSNYATANCSVNSCSGANTYKVGPSRSYTTLNQLFGAVDLQPGDLVEVDGDATYAGGVIIPSADGGSASQPVVIKGLQVNGRRPLLSGGTNTIEFRQSNHVVLDGFEITGGTSRCVFMAAHNVTIRDSIIRDCPRHGILSADNYSGSLTLEYNEIRSSGEGTQHHPLYIQSDQISYPNAVFTMRFNYVHSGNGGNLLKSRHERNLIYYNWFEGATYHEVEMIGPDAYTQLGGWNIDTKREDSNVVGNVIVHTNTSFGASIRVGGDLPENSSKGRYRFANNTVYFTSSSGVVFRMFETLQSLEAHNNVFSGTGAGSGIQVARTTEATWTNGTQLHGSYNSVKSGAASVPTSWVSTQNHTSAGFTGTNNYTPATGSVLLDAGTSSATSSGNSYPFLDPLLLPAYHPPMRAKMSPGSEVPRNVMGGQIDIGAFER